MSVFVHVYVEKLNQGERVNDNISGGGQSCKMLIECQFTPKSVFYEMPLNLHFHSICRFFLSL